MSGHDDHSCRSECWAGRLEIRRAGASGVASTASQAATRTMVAATRKLTVTYKLVHATPSKLYQVGVHIFCSKFPKTFGQFPVQTPTPGTCTPITRQGVTKTAIAVEFGVVTTDIHGNGSFTVVVGPFLASNSRS